MAEHAPVTEEELHAYVDGELPSDRIAAVESYLASNPEDAARVASWRAQAAAIRERWGGAFDEPVPERLQIDKLSVKASGLWPKIAAAAALAFLIGGTAGWFGRDLARHEPVVHVETHTQIAKALADAAIEAHRLYINEVRHPIEVRAHEEHLLRWLSRRVGSTVRAPDLSDEGLKLLGGRLLPGPKSPTALIMYEGPGGERLTVTCTSSGTDGETAFKWRESGEFGALAWIEGGLAFVVAGPAERERLDRVARRIYAAYETSGVQTR